MKTGEIQLHESLEAIVQLHVLAALSLGEKAPDSHWIGGCFQNWSGCCEEEKSLAPARN
jgi:hypothetical protein